MFVSVCILQQAPSYYEKLLDVSIEYDVCVFVTVDVYHYSKAVYRISIISIKLMIS